MFKVDYSSNLKWEITVSASKNAALPILAANFLVNKKVNLTNLPDIVDVNVLDEIWDTYLQKWTLVWPMTERIRSSILLIPVWLYKYGKISFSNCGGCSLWKRPLDTFDNAFEQAWVKVLVKSDRKIFRTVSKPKKKIILSSFSVTATEAILIYLAFLDKIDYEIEIANIAIEPHVIDLIDFLKNIWANIRLWYDHRVFVKPWNIHIKNYEYSIVSDYIEAGTYFGLGAIADDSEIIIKNINPSHLESVFTTADKIWINYEYWKDFIKVNSFNKKNYKPTNIQTMIYPWFPTDLQSIFWILLTQIKWISKIHEVLFEWRFAYFAELENMWAHIEILNPHEVLIVWWKQLIGTYVNTRDLRAWAWLILSWVVAKWTTFITNESIIKRGYEDIVAKLQWIWVKIEEV